ncbi:type I-D CRISPR-associated protein Cas10d/Csc3 [Geitlerinema sp. PCC 9228]|uniref:type I-D CRISPR-associated protein Cas10d/Csc3 n=1 Tax=Geitlerinema sp. PCC 9228 TaxID=111611 RepID=UPI0008F9DD2C|nr:type I-D CRISPR-associated protein Cas10d/Csc3 [Geitlerinema sp. PCC 9228]
MAKKRKNNNTNIQQLSLFEQNSETENDDWLDDEDLDLDFETSDRTVAPQSTELLTLKLLKRAILENNPGDRIMQDFAEHVLPNLLHIAIGVTAKGGKFFVRREREAFAAGKTIDRRNAADQSLNTHLLNGLFPANLIEQKLEQIDTTIQRTFQQRERRLGVAGFILHDFEKFPDVANDCRQLDLEKHRQIIDEKVRQLGLDRFLNPDHPTEYRDYIDDLLAVAYNAQRRWDTNWNFSSFGLHPTLRDRVLVQLTDLACLADSLSSIIKHPQDAENKRLNELIHSLSDGQLKFTYHAIAENRGVLTNILNNALMQAHIEVGCQPLLYLPTGVIYLANRSVPQISIENIPNRAIENIKTLCRDRLLETQTGFGRDGKGLKYAEYYDQFFGPIDLMQIALRATLRILNPKKDSVAKIRSQKLQEYCEKGVLSNDCAVDFKEDIRIDRIAEFGDVISRKIWGGCLKRLEQYSKTQKNIPAPPQLDLIEEAAKLWQLEKHLPQIRQIQHINESMKERKLKGNTGGVPYAWYYLAAQYLERYPGIEDVRETCEQLIAHFAHLIEPILAQYSLPDGWDDIRQWIERVIMLSGTTNNDSSTVFQSELERYQLAKKPGRGRQLLCSVSHSPDTVTEQMESAVLFTPQVYTNKQTLGGSNAKRNISSIAGTEMMLRQILMNQTQAVGKRFEDGKYRYLYFYPTYYFTPETNKFLALAYSNIAQTQFHASLRNHFIDKEFQADFSKYRYQTVDAFLIDEDLQRKKDLPEGNPERKYDRTFKLSYPEDQPLTFYFMALPPGKNSTDTESWIMPAWLALAFPMILDVKTVVSESPIPPFVDGAAFEETVFLDSAPQALRSLLQRDRFRLDSILEKDSEIDSDRPYTSPLNALTAAYAIHLDVNAKQSKGKYEANWGKFADLARDLETSPLHVFSYLKKWARRQEVDIPRIEKIRLYAHIFYPCFDPQVEFKETLQVNQQSHLHHPKKLTELYRSFYRASKKYNPKSNAVLKPIDIAAQTILDADPSYQGEALVDAVAAKVYKLMDRVHSSTAEGYWILKDREAEREAILQFARYFVHEVFENTFGGDRARLAGKQLNLIKDTCEFLYRLEDDKENQNQT